jgi:hypothetical protein
LRPVGKIPTKLITGVMMQNKKYDSPESEDSRAVSQVEEDTIEQEDEDSVELYHGGMPCATCGSEDGAGCSDSMGLMGGCGMGVTVGSDPVSGNPIPAGSTAKNVRDDIPALLSEGEYVVPADVLNYHGLKFFESLRDEAKLGLMDMAFAGQIQSYNPEKEDEETHTMPDGTEMEGATHEEYSEDEDSDVDEAMVETSTETMDGEETTQEKQARDLSYKPTVKIALMRK